MKAYRRRFVLFNMLMVGVVLTAMVAGVAVYMYRDYYDSLHDTMAQVVKPLSALSGETADADPRRYGGQQRCREYSHGGQRGDD